MPYIHTTVNDKRHLKQSTVRTFVGRFKELKEKSLRRTYTNVRNSGWKNCTLWETTRLMLIVLVRRGRVNIYMYLYINNIVEISETCVPNTSFRSIGHQSYCRFLYRADPFHRRTATYIIWTPPPPCRTDSIELDEEIRSREKKINPCPYTMNGNILTLSFNTRYIVYTWKTSKYIYIHIIQKR